jgi:hypothetical protein
MPERSCGISAARPTAPSAIAIGTVPKLKKTIISSPASIQPAPHFWTVFVPVARTKIEAASTTAHNPMRTFASSENELFMVAS